MTFIAVRCPHCESEQIVKRRKTHRGTQRYLCQNTGCTRGREEFASNKLEDQEMAMLSLPLLQVSLVYINTLMIQQVLAEPAWQGRLTAVDLRALTPLLWAHVNPYGTFTLDMSARLPLEQAA